MKNKDKFTVTYDRNRMDILKESIIDTINNNIQDCDDLYVSELVLILNEIN